MGQQISAAAESVGPGAATAGAAGLPHPAIALGVISDAGGVVSQPTSQSQPGETVASRAESNHHPSQSGQQQPNKTWSAASFDSMRALPPLPKPPPMPNAPSSLGNSLDPGGGARAAVTGAGDQGDSQGSDMELGKMSIREAIDSFIERCLHNSNDGGASDNESSEESTNGQQSRATVANIFALDHASKRSPSSSCQSPSTPLKDKDSIPKGRLSDRDLRTSRDSSSSSSSPKPSSDRGERDGGGRQQERGEKTPSERRDSNGENSKDSNSNDEKPALSSAVVMKIDPGVMDEGEDTVLVIDCDTQDKEDNEDSKDSGSPVRDDDGKSSPPAKRESITPKLERSDSKPHVTEETNSETGDSVRAKTETRDFDEKVAKDSVKKSASDRPGSQSPEVTGSPSHQPRSNLLMWELSKKPMAQSSSPGGDGKSVRPTPFLPGPKQLQFIIDRVLDSSLNESSESSPNGMKSKEEAAGDSDKKSSSASSPKDSNIEIIKVEEPVPMEALDLKSSTKEKSERNVLKEQMAQSKVPMCFKDHIEKVLLESFLSYEEEERREALKKEETPVSASNADGKSGETGGSDASFSKSVTSQKNAISVQDIVDRVITQTEAINKNMSGPSASDTRTGGQGEGRHSTAGGHDSSQPPSSGSSSRSHPSSTSSSASTAEASYPNPNYPHQNPHLPHQHQQHGNSSQPMSSQEKALQDAQRHVVLKEHQSSTTTARKRGRPRRVSPSASSSINSHPHHNSSMADYRHNALGAGHHYPDERARAGHLPHHGPPPPPLDYNPHGSLSFGLPPGVSALLPPPGSASMMRQHQIEHHRQQQQHAKDIHNHGLHGPPAGSGAYPPPGSRNHQRDSVPHHMDMHHPRSHLPPHAQQHPSGGVSSGGSSNSGGGGSSSASGIKPPPPLILADSISSGSRIVPVSHIPTKSCSCHSCIAHFSGSASSSSSAPSSEPNGSPAAQHARLVQHQQGLRPGSSGGRHDGRENSRSPHRQQGHAGHPPHPAYNAGSYPVSSPPSSSSSSSRHGLPPSAKDYYGQHGHGATSRGGECLRPVVSMSSRGLPPRAIIPTFVAAQRQQQHQRDGPGSSGPGHGPESQAACAPSPNHPHSYPRENSLSRYYDSKSSSASSSSTSSSTHSTNSYPHYPPGSQHHHPSHPPPPPPGHSHNPHHPHHHHPHQQPPHLSSPSSQHHKPSHVDHRYPPQEHESSRHHPDYIPPPPSAGGAGSSAPSHYPYDQQRSHRDLPSSRSYPHHSGSIPPSSSSSLRTPSASLPPPGNGTSRQPAPAPVESDADAPLDLSVKPSRKLEPSQPERGETAVTQRGSAGHPSPADTDSRAYRRRSLEMPESRGGQYKNPGDYQEPPHSSQQPHYLQTLENSVDRILPHQHHQRSPYQGQNHPHQQQQQQQNPHAPPSHPHHQSHHHSHLRASSSPHGPRSNPDPHQAGGLPSHHLDHHQDSRSSGYSGPSSRSQQSPAQQRGNYAPPPHPHHHAPAGSNPPPHPGMYPHYPLASTSPSAPHHPPPHPHSHPHRSQPQPPPPPHHHHYPPQSQHHSRSSSGSSSNANSNSGGGGGSGGSSSHNTVPSPSPQNFYSRSPVPGRPQAVSPASAGPHSYHPKALDSSPHPPYPHAAFPPPPPQSSSPYQRPPSHNQEGDNSRPSPVNSSHPSAGPPPPLARRPSDTTSPDEEDPDGQGKLNISKHEPIQNIIGNHSPGDILYLICRLCRQTYGNPYGFRKHFRKEHGFEPKEEHTVVQTISATKNAMAHPPALDHNADGGRGGLDKSGGYPPHHSDNHSRSNHPYPPQQPHVKQEDMASKDGPKYYAGDNCSSEGGVPPPKRSEVLKDQKLLECAECSQTFQLNDFGAYKRHCRQHSGGPGSGPFLCHDCHRCFAEPDQLQEHLNTHADFTPSVCGICLTPFSAPDYLAEHLKAAHGHTINGSNSSSLQTYASTPAWDKSDGSTGSASRQGAERKPGYFPDGNQYGKSWGPSGHNPHPSIVMGTSEKSSSGASVSSSWSSSTSSSAAIPSSRRTAAEHGEPQHAVVHTPRDLQVEKLPADPAVMTASPDSSYSDEKLYADSQTGSNLSFSKTAATTSQGSADHGSNSLKQRDRDSDSNSNSPLPRGRDAASMRSLSSPLARQSRDSSKPQTPTPQSASANKQTAPQSDPSRSAAKDDSESVSSDRCASVESGNSLSIEGSRTSSPGVDEPDFSYKHKKYSRYNRKRSTETSSMSGEPGPKSARSSSAESNAPASGLATSTTTTSTSRSSLSSSALVSQCGGKNENNLSPVVTSSANNARDCESSTSNANPEESGRSRSPNGKYSNSSKRGDSGDSGQRDSHGKKHSSSSSTSPSEESHASKDIGMKNTSDSSSKKRKADDNGSSTEEKSGGKWWSSGAGEGNDDSSGSESSGKFKWERMTRSQMGKTSQSVSYTSSN